MRFDRLEVQNLEGVNLFFDLNQGEEGLPAAMRGIFCRRLIDEPTRQQEAILNPHVYVS